MCKLAMGVIRGAVEFPVFISSFLVLERRAYVWRASLLSLDCLEKIIVGFVGERWW